MKRLSQAATSVVAPLFLLIGCGGGGSAATSQPTTPTQPTPTPVVVDHAGLTPIDPQTPTEQEFYSAGDATVFNNDHDAFSRRPNAVAADFQLDGFFTSGDHLFRSPHQNIGPLLNTSNCQGCHLNDGKGKVPANPDRPMTSMFLKIAQAKIMNLKKMSINLI